MRWKVRNLRIPFVAVLALLCVSASVSAQPSFAVINGSPLKIHVGSDASFQIFNAAVPGVGQVYPTGTDLADMGVFARINGQLFAPNFAAHGVTATSNLGQYTPWQSLGGAASPTGDGSPESPYAVALAVKAPGTAVHASVLVTYVNGNNFFRIRTQYFGTEGAPETLNAFLAADIYLANSDFGTFIAVPELAAVGGHNCNPADGDYNILLIPITTADRYATDTYSGVWAQIGAGDLLNIASNTSSCVDNGAAIEWTDLFATSTAVEVNAAVSFGEVPSASNFHGFSVKVEPDNFALNPGESQAVTITTRRNVELEFNAPIVLSAPDLPIGMTLTLDQNVVPAPGDGVISGTVSIDGRIFPQVYRSLAVLGSGGNETRAGTFNVEILCTPPTFLGTQQPQSQTVPRGQPATFSAVPSRDGLFTWQWFNNHWPLTGSPVPDSNAAQLVTAPVNEVQSFWARVTNPCGSADTLTATVVPTN